MLTSLLLLFLNIDLGKYRIAAKTDRTETMVYAITLWCVILLFMTELLSVFHAFVFRNVLSSWAAVAIILLLLYMIQLRHGRGIFHEYVALVTGNKVCWILAVIGLGVVVLAIKTVPYNWDSMTYHLSRIAHWNQNGSVAHYGTNSLRQISSPVLAEFIGLHIYTLMRGNDIFMNLVQCMSYLADTVLVVGIARKLGCSVRFRFVAGLLFMSMPIAFAEALTTQVDNVAAMWLLGFVYIMLDLVKNGEGMTFEKFNIWRVVCLGLCVAMGYLTKPSIGFGIVIFIIWLLIISIRKKDKLFNLLRLAVCAFPAVVLPVLPELMRNISSFHAIASSGTGARQLVGTLNPAYLVVNLAKNISFNLPNIYMYKSNWFYEKCVFKLASLLHVDIDCPTISEAGREFQIHAPQTYGHDTAVNPVILFFTIFMCFWLIYALIRKNSHLEGKAVGYSLSAVISFLVFCVFLRWEPFVSRYMISYMALLCPMVAVLLQDLTKDNRLLPVRHMILGILYMVCAVELLGMVVFHKKVSEHGERFPAYFVNRGGGKRV